MVEPAGSWEAERVFGTVTFAALGDPALIDDDEWRRGDMPLLRVRDDGLGMIFAPAEADDVPVELLREGPEIVAARMEFVDDVAELESSGEGAWVSHGRLRIGESGAVGLALEGSFRLSIAVDLRSGWYRAESFAAKGDVLGLRLTADEDQSDG